MGKEYVRIQRKEIRKMDLNNLPPPFKLPKWSIPSPNLMRRKRVRVWGA